MSRLNEVVEHQLRALARGECEMFPSSVTLLFDEIDALRVELAEADERAASAAREERTRIVEYLRDVSKQYELGDMVPQDDYFAEAYLDAADTIEACDHRKGSVT